MIYLIYGNEPYRLNVYKNKVRNTIIEPALNYREMEQWEETLLEFASGVPFFDEKRVIIIRNQNLDDLKLPNLQPYKKYFIDADLHLIVNKIDRRKSIYSLLKKMQVSMIVKNKEESILEQFIVSFLKKNGCSIRQDTYRQLCSRLNYFNENMNLYFVEQELLNLVTHKGEIMQEEVKKCIAENPEEKIYEVIQMLCKGEASEMYQQIELIIKKETEAISFLSLLLRTFRIQWKHCLGISIEEMKIYNKTYLPDTSMVVSMDCIKLIQDYISSIKMGKLPAKTAVELCIAQLYNCIH